MSNHIYTYALIKSLYDQGEDYLDSFWPFAVKVLPTNRSFIELNNIQKNIKDKYDLDIPLHTLKSILNRAKSNNYVEFKDKLCNLTECGLKYLDDLETDNDVERRLNSLFHDVESFLNRHEIFISFQSIPDEIFSFLNKNALYFKNFFNHSSGLDQQDISNITDFDKYFINYIEEAENKKIEHYKTLQDVVFGSIISTIINSKEYSNIREIKSKKFKHCKIFLDSNIIFSILDLGNQEFTKPALELLDLLKKYKFEIKVFSFTVDEICRVIRGYTRDVHMYPISIKIDTLYSRLRQKKWTKSNAIEFVTNIESTLSKNGIEIELVNDIDIKNYNPKDKNIKDIVAKHKPLAMSSSINHDTAAIEMIKKLRRGSIRAIEASEALFLTSDKILSKCNFLEMGHDENGTISEVILDCLLTNILWLKDPNANISLKLLIGAYSRELFIKRRIWEQFYSTLRALKSEDKIKDEDITMLFYNSFLEDILIKFDESETSKITPEFIFEKVEEASKLSEKNTEKRVKQKEEELLKHLNEKLSEKD